MAKEIKVIECPKCGSTQNIEIKPDYYRCSNCNTEYFIDNNDVNINYNNGQNDLGLSGLKNKKTGSVLAVLIVIIIVIFVLFRFLSPNSSVKYKDAPIVNNLEKETIRWSSPDLETFLNGVGKPMILVVGEKDVDGSRDKNSFYADVFDATTNKNIKSSKLEGITQLSSNNIAIRTFVNGEIYFIVNKTNAFKLDKTNYTVAEATTSLFKNSKELSVGLAKIEFGDPDEGDGFRVLTNDGNEFNYYPATEKIYTKDELWEASQGFKNLVANATEKSGFTFTSYVPGGTGGKTQLIKYFYKDNGGGPKNKANFGWDRQAYKDSSPSGFSFKKVLLTDFYRNLGRITSFSDFTPNRVYLKPKVLFSDDKILLIFFPATAAQKAPIILQCMDSNTGAIIFSTHLNYNSYLKRAIHYKNGIVAEDNQKAYNIGLDGKVINTYSLW